MATENENTQVIIGCAIEVHKNLGPGLLESVYEESLCYELKQSNMTFKRQQQVPIKYKSAKLTSLRHNGQAPESAGGLIPSAETTH